MRSSTFVFETHLLHAVHLQVNLDVFGTTSFFLDVHVVCQHQQTKLFVCQTAFCIFSGSCMMFFNYFMDKENVFGICDELEVI